MPGKPFKTIAMTVAVSPNLEANIAEALRVKEALGQRLILIHIGERTAKGEEKLKEVFEKYQIDQENTDLIWKNGDQVNAILKVCAEKKVDLLVASATPREGLLKYYRGSIARGLVRKSNCSILLMTYPNELKSKYPKIVVNGLDHPKTAYTIEMAIRVGECFQSTELVIAEEVVPSRVAKHMEDDKNLEQAKKGIQKKEAKRIENILTGIKMPERLKVSQKYLFGKPGYSIGHFTEQFQANLLVMNSPDTKLGFLDRVFTHDLEYILSELPSDLLIVHSSEPSL